MEFTRIADQKRVDFIRAAVGAQVLPGSAILDIGCGNGLISMALGEMGYRVTGIDLSEKTIAAARENNTLENVQFEVVAAGELTPQPGKYQAIVCSEVLEHLQQPEELLKIIYASLPDDGILIVTVPNGAGPRELLVTRPVQRMQQQNNIVWRTVSRLKTLMGYKGITVQSNADDLTHLQFFTLRILSSLATSANFVIKEIRPTNFIEQVFPFSLVAKRSSMLQKIDCALAERLPLRFTSGFMSIWIKK